MFGYIAANMGDLTEEEKERYRQAYCGLCCRLGGRHGQLSRLGLTYDMTFLILLLSSLYEPDECNGSLRCPAHPIKRQEYFYNGCTDYAADMTVALTWYKCMDDWKDEHKALKRAYAAALKKEYAAVQGQRPQQCRVFQDCMEKLERIEKQGGYADEAANAFGTLMGEVFIYKKDEWEMPLRQFGDYLGRFIYMMDAAMDFEQDKKTGNYNPILASGRTPDDMREAMTLLVGRAAAIFERLPLVQDVRLLRSILYAGVWQKYNQKLAKEGGGTYDKGTA